MEVKSLSNEFWAAVVGSWNGTGWLTAARYPGDPPTTLHLIPIGTWSARFFPTYIRLGTVPFRSLVASLKNGGFHLQKDLFFPGSWYALDQCRAQEFHNLEIRAKEPPFEQFLMSEITFWVP